MIFIFIFIFLSKKNLDLPLAIISQKTTALKLERLETQ